MKKQPQKQPTKLVEVVGIAGTVIVLASIIFLITAIVVRLGMMILSWGV